MALGSARRVLMPLREDGAACAVVRVRFLAGAHALELVLGPPQLAAGSEQSRTVWVR